MKKTVLILTAATIGLIGVVIAAVLLFGRTPGGNTAASQIAQATTAKKTASPAGPSVSPTPYIAPNAVSVNADANILMELGNPRVLVGGVLRLLETQYAGAPLLSENGITSIPVAFLAEATGGQYSVDPASGAATLAYAADTIRIEPGKAQITAKGRTIALGAPASFRNGQLCAEAVPLLQALNFDYYIQYGILYIRGAKIDATDPATLSFMDSGVSRITAVRSVGTVDNLLAMMNLNANNSGRTFYPQLGIAAIPSSALMVLPTAADFIPTAPPVALSESGDAYSTTNVQVAGVDEGDSVKTDGKYIYNLTADSIVIIDATSPTALKLAAEVKFDNPNFTASELYVDGANLVLVGNKRYDPALTGLTPGTADYYALRDKRRTQVFVYDISDPTAPRQIRFLETDGMLASTRKIGQAIYIVSNNADSRYYKPTAETVRPYSRDSLLAGGEALPVDPSRIYYFDEYFQPGYLMIASFRLDQPEVPMNADAYLGAGTDIYCSMESLYVTYPLYAQYHAQNGVPSSKTMVLKFALNDGKATYLSGNAVPGTVHNQYSMDEYLGNFRITTTGDSFTPDWVRHSGNNAYVLDPELNLLGRLENLAQGETIYSVRFMGARGYMVTYRKVDPLFVLDFTDPTAPAVLGKLKIPGYSDYLHPYDENHLLGFGKETVVDGTISWYQGMKVSVFDVTDPANPIEESKVLIGDRGTSSYLLEDPKALLFSKARGLMAFPVELFEIAGKTETTLPYTFGTRTYQGAYVFAVGTDASMTLRGRITHSDIPPVPNMTDT